MKSCYVLVLLVIHLSGYNSEIYEDRLSVANNFGSRYSFWPSLHNGVTAMRIKKRAAVDGQSEGGTIAADEKQQPGLAKDVKTAHNMNNENDENTNKTLSQKGNDTINKTSTVVLANNTASNITIGTNTSQADLSNPGVVKRGLIVFGGFTLLGVAYFIFYKRKNVKNDNINTHSTSDGPQFRYGVLQSEDRRDNLEQSRMPLTMESDEDYDDDDDLEIFDLEQKKKSMSYENQSNVRNTESVNILTDSSQDNARDTLLLDIDERPTDNSMLINLTTSSHKSVL